MERLYHNGKLMKTILLISIILTLLSCETYRRSKLIRTWTDEQNITHTVYKYSYYVRRNDSLYCVVLDTTLINPNHKEVKPVVKESKKVSIDQQWYK
jgi:hypothetical protein